MLMEYDISGSTVARYTMGLGIDSPIAIKTQNTTGYYHADGLGTVREITSSTGAVLNSYIYDAWGNIQSSSETISQPFTFTSREWDSDAGLYYYRARYMDASVGRFTAMDPALGDAEDPFSFHGYNYVYNNPVNSDDPMGEGIITMAMAAGVIWGLYELREYVLDCAGDPPDPSDYLCDAAYLAARKEWEKKRHQCFWEALALWMFWNPHHL